MPGVPESYDLTPIQSGMLVHALRSPGRGVDIQQIVARQPKAYQRDALVAAWSTVLARHAALRTAFEWHDRETPRQVVHAPDGVTLPITEDDWSALAPAEQDEWLERYLRTDRARDFDLACPPLMRVHLVRLSPTASLFVWTFHHALLDGRAFDLVLEDLYAFLDRDGPEAAATNCAASHNPALHSETMSIGSHGSTWSRRAHTSEAGSKGLPSQASFGWTAMTSQTSRGTPKHPAPPPPLPSARSRDISIRSQRRRWRHKRLPMASP